MNVRIAAVCLFVGLAPLSGAASAKGCLKGAAVGGVAGHVAGNHGVAGAAVGCAVGHHRAKVKDKQATAATTAPAVNAPAPNANTAAPAQR